MCSTQYFSLSLRRGPEQGSRRTFRATCLPVASSSASQTCVLPAEARYKLLPTWQSGSKRKPRGALASRQPVHSVDKRSSRGAPARSMSDQSLTVVVGAVPVRVANARRGKPCAEARRTAASVRAWYLETRAGILRWLRLGFPSPGGIAATPCARKTPGGVSGGLAPICCWRACVASRSALRDKNCALFADTRLRVCTPPSHLPVCPNDSHQPGQTDRQRRPDS